MWLSTIGYRLPTRRMMAIAVAASICPLVAAQVGPAPTVTLEEMTIVGDREELTTTTGAASVIDAHRLAQFQHTDIQQIVREIPGVSVQLEDGYGLRPNLSIRGTASERSGRITLLEDNVLIAPAPYSAPSAYYFPTAGRMHQVEVLKGSASVRQGPYTVGGAMNFISTPIAGTRAGFVNMEVLEHDTTRLHGAYSDSKDRYGWLLETHLWDSDGFQTIDFSDGNTGLDKDDWMGKLRLNSDPGATVYQQLDIKLQYATEDSAQSYLGLTDADFGANPYRRYSVSALDNISTEHDQVIVRYLAQWRNGVSATATLYNNNHKRNWFKTEGLDADGSASAADFDGASWFSVVQAVNADTALGTLTAADLQALLDGGDSASGAIQVRSNARQYFSRGIQLGLDWDFVLGSAAHELELGVRLHEDEEDRLQRNSTYTQTDGQLSLADIGRLGNAGNRIQDARALAVHVYDRITWGDWVFTPGVRYEDITQERIRYETRDGLTADPASRAAANVRDTRRNTANVVIPGVGALYRVNDALAMFAGVHKGFTAPSNAPGVSEEKSINYEAGLRFTGHRLFADAAVFFTDYDNILGECTASSGSDCDVGDAFNGDAASILGLELLLNYDLSSSAAFALPVTLSYTYLDGQFDSDIADTDFFGDVSAGDRLPYIPRHQFLLSLGLERGKWSAYLNTNYVDDTCVRASCGAFERTENILLMDLAAHYRMGPRMTVYAKLDNLTSEQTIVARQPYGARPNKDRTLGFGLRVDL